MDYKNMKLKIMTGATAVCAVAHADGKTTS